MLILISFKNNFIQIIWNQPFFIVALIILILRKILHTWLQPFFSGKKVFYIEQLMETLRLCSYYSTKEWILTCRLRYFKNRSLTLNMHSQFVLHHNCSSYTVVLHRCLRLGMVQRSHKCLIPTTFCMYLSNISCLFFFLYKTSITYKKSLTLKILAVCIFLFFWDQKIQMQMWGKSLFSDI